MRKLVLVAGTIGLATISPQAVRCHHSAGRNPFSSIARIWIAWTPTASNNCAPDLAASTPTNRNARQRRSYARATAETNAARVSGSESPRGSYTRRNKKNSVRAKPAATSAAPALERLPFKNPGNGSN
jgi:hypothetical protein